MILATEGWRVVHQEIAGTVDGVVGVADLACRWTRGERTRVQIGRRIMAQQSWLQVLAVVESTLMPAERAGAASLTTARTTAHAAQATKTTEYPGSTAAAPAVSVSAAAVAAAAIAAGASGVAASARRTSATAKIVVQAAGRSDQQSCQGSN